MRRDDLCMLLRLGGAFSSALLPALAVAASPPYYELEIAPPLEGHDSAYPADMTEHGTVIGIAGSDPYDPIATPVVFGRGRIVPLAKPDDSLNFVLGTSRVGWIAGTSLNFPVLWRQGEPLFLLPPDGWAQGFASDVAASGVVVGTMINDITARQVPTIWTSSDAPGRILPGLPGVPDGAAFAINSRDTIGGVIGGTGTFVGARWDDPAQPPLQIGPLANAINSEVLALNNRGDAAGRSGFADGTVEAMLYLQQDHMATGLGHLDGSYSVAYALNDSQQVVGTSAAGDLVHAFLWHDGVLYDLNDLVAGANEPFDYLASAVAIDTLGRIAVEAVVPGAFAPVSRIAILRPIVPSHE